MSHDHNARFLQRRNLCEECFAGIGPDVRLCEVCAAEEENNDGGLKMHVPTVHLNGTSKNELINQLVKAMDACRDAEVALRAASPHGRDYYPQGENVIHGAIAEHNSREQRIHEVYTELEAIALAIDQA